MNFVPRTINHRYDILIPEDFVNHLHVTRSEGLLGHYEPEHLLSMERLLKPGDNLFVCGAETGWLTTVMARFVGGGHVGLFEPSDAQWPAIHATWLANELPDPLLTFTGFVGSKTRPPAWQGGITVNEALRFRGDSRKAGLWPGREFGNVWKTEYRSLKERGGIDIPVVTIDDVVKVTNIVPRALTIDVEGAEYEVLKGARNTLVLHHPLIWLSIHQVRRPGEGDTGPLVYDYHSSREEVLQYVTSLGYTATFLEDSMDEQYLLEAR